MKNYKLINHLKIEERELQITKFEEKLFPVYQIYFFKKNTTPKKVFKHLINQNLKMIKEIDFRLEKKKTIDNLPLRNFLNFGG